jgi:hypothetical protein
MFKTVWPLPVLTTVLLLTCPLSAQQPTAANAYALEVRLRSINDLLQKADYIAGLFGQQQALGALLQQIPLDQQKGSLLGFDTRRPLGAYGGFDTFDFKDGSGVLLLPVADLDALLGLLQIQLGVQVEKKPDGTLVVPLPQELGPVDTLYARFSNGYLYVSGKQSDIDPKKLVPPRAFFAKDDGSILSVTLRPDHIPTPMRREVLARMRQAAEIEALNRDPGSREAYLSGAKFAENTFRVLFEEVKELSLKLFVNEKQDYLSAELLIVPQPHSDIAKSIAGLGQQTSKAYGITAISNIVLRGNLNFAIPEELRSSLENILLSAMEQESNTKKNDPAQQKLLQAVLPTLKAGVADAAVSVTLPDARGHSTVLLAIGVREGKKIDTALREAINKLKESQNISYKFEVARAGNFVIHQLDDFWPAEVKPYLGSRHLWLAMSDDLMVLSAGPNINVLRSSLGKTVTASKAPVLSLDASLVGMARWFNSQVTPQQINQIVSKVFGATGPVGKDVLRLELVGGQNVHLRLSVQGGGIRFLSQLIGLQQD